MQGVVRAALQGAGRCAQGPLPTGAGNMVMSYRSRHILSSKHSLAGEPGPSGRSQRKSPALCAHGRKDNNLKFKIL